jgi:hypothetical protein
LEAIEQKSPLPHRSPENIELTMEASDVIRDALRGRLDRQAST